MSKLTFQPTTTIFKLRSDRQTFSNKQLHQLTESVFVGFYSLNTLKACALKLVQATADS